MLNTDQVALESRVGGSGGGWGGGGGGGKTREVKWRRWSKGFLGFEIPNSRILGGVQKQIGVVPSEALGIFEDFDSCPLSIIPVPLTPEYTPRPLNPPCAFQIIKITFN